MAKQPSTAVATTDSPSQLPANPGQNFEAYAGAGMENVTASDLLVPRIAVLQQLSPQLNKTKPEHIPGAELGMIADLGTGEVFKDGIIYLPVYFRKDYLEWAPRASGKGLVKVHTDPAVMDSAKRNDKNQPILANGNLIAETAQWFGMILSTSDRRKCFIPLTSTQLKVSRRWMSLATGEKLKRADGSEFTAPLFYRTYHMTTATASNNQGEWGVFKVERGKSLPEYCSEFGINEKDLIDEALKFRDSVMKGETKADTRGMEASAEEAHPAGEKM
tara:strand:- start:22 stop:846 length:825 start_codon:yes stop_codon:yes gene_type:complete